MGIKLVATCLTLEQAEVCDSMGIENIRTYARSYGEIRPGCVTDFSVHCFNSDALDVLKTLGVSRATLHPELNLAQMRDIKKSIHTEAVVYGRLPLMVMKHPPTLTSKSKTSSASGVNIGGKSLGTAEITDRTNTRFFFHGDCLYNSVPVFMADKLAEVQKAGIICGRLMFTAETANETREIIMAYLNRKAITIQFTRGKFYSRV